MVKRSKLLLQGKEDVPVAVLDSDEEEDERENTVKELIAATSERIMTSMMTVAASAEKRLALVEDKTEVNSREIGGLKKAFKKIHKASKIKEHKKKMKHKERRALKRQPHQRRISKETVGVDKSGVSESDGMPVRSEVNNGPTVGTIGESIVDCNSDFATVDSSGEVISGDGCAHDDADNMTDEGSEEVSGDANGGAVVVTSGIARGGGTVIDSMTDAVDEGSEEVSGIASGGAVQSSGEVTVDTIGGAVVGSGEVTVVLAGGADGGSGEVAVGDDDR